MLSYKKTGEREDVTILQATACVCAMSPRPRAPTFPTHSHLPTMRTATATTPISAFEEDLVARVKDLGPYDHTGADEDIDRAYTERCWVTFVSLPNGDSLELHQDNGLFTGVLETATGDQRRLTPGTTSAILTVIDQAHFPIYHD